ncbi:MAG: hypothetical protein AB8B72_10065, partial [Crocinitomicaceae bacterium]
VIATINLGSIQQINQVAIGCLQDIKSWIWYPSRIEIWTSTDGVDLSKYGDFKNNFDRNKYGSFTEKFAVNRKVKAKYVKVKLEYPGDCPPWHLGKGGKAWVFVDEITIK